MSYSYSQNKVGNQDSSPDHLPPSLSKTGAWLKDDLNVLFQFYSVTLRFDYKLLEWYK